MRVCVCVCVCVCVRACVCVRVCVCAQRCEWRANRDTVVTQSEVAVLVHIDTDLPRTHPICLHIAEAHLTERNEEKESRWHLEVVADNPGSRVSSGGFF